MDKTSFKCVRPVVIPILATLLIGLLAGCSSVPLNEQKALIQKRQYAPAESALRDAIRIGDRPGSNRYPVPLARKLLDELPVRDGSRRGDSLRRR